MKPILIKSYIFLLLSLLFSTVSCEKDEEILEPKYAKPALSLVSGTNSGSFAIGRVIKVPIQLTATGFLDRLVVQRNGTAFSSTDYSAGGSRIFDFEVLVDATWLGTSQIFTFILTDKQGNQSDVFTYTATISNLVPTYTIVPVTLNNETFNKITGIINFDETLTPASKWIISGAVTVDAIATLTIAPGTTIYAETAATSMNVLAGGKINASGTAALPIVFTTLNAAPGQSGTVAPGNWSALNVNGNATTSAGIYKYLRVEFAGNATDAFKLITVSNLTTVENIQIFRSADNGLRINGGNVNVKRAVATANVAVGIRYGLAWTGNGQFWVANMNNTAMTGIQGRDANSFPTLSNITVTGSIFNGGTVAEGEGIRIRNSAKAKVYNAVVTGVNTSFRASDGSENFIPTGDVFLRNSASFNNIAGTTTGFHSSANLFNPTNAGYVASNNNSVTAFAIAANYVGTSTANSVDPTTLGSFFEAANYTGAVQTGSDWTVGWTKNTNGSMR